MRIPFTGLAFASCAGATLLVSGCAGATGTAAGTHPAGEVFLQPAAAPGPDPFTHSTATTAAASAPTSIPASDSVTPSRPAATPARDVRSLSGATPGLYGGTAHVAGCDVERQIGYLAADPAKGVAFAQGAGISPASVPGYLRGLTPVVLRADTRVTNHGYQDGRATEFQSLLQAGTAVLVDDRGVPRVRCACGNPLRPPTAHSGSATGGTGWSGYRPAEVVEVAPAPHAVTSITIVDVHSHTWIERPIGHGVAHDHVVPAPAPATPTPAGKPPHSGKPSPHVTRPGETGKATPTPTPDASASASASVSASAPTSASAPALAPASASASAAASPSASPSPSRTAGHLAPPTAPSRPQTPSAPHRSPSPPQPPGQDASPTAPGTSPDATVPDETGPPRGTGTSGLVPEPPTGSAG
ncbi:DUF6777 domain-containing protein [Streptomyces sp. L2]|uniref:DUF6777 domain-containing protein n=1 Tax=Streptomyces sp. L2 TaxID=2162665 RepID=UPI001011573E|nr:DUF6777 domain-containing protein [Streptomyces sp. L2]